MKPRAAGDGISATCSLTASASALSIAGGQHWLWCAVNHNGFVLDVLIHPILLLDISSSTSQSGKCDELRQSIRPLSAQHRRRIDLVFSTAATD